MKLSCVVCRQKKIKCDREQPCGYCQKAGTTCVPQTRAKIKRRIKKPADTQVLERLKQLENIVSRLESDGSTQPQSPPEHGSNAYGSSPVSHTSPSPSIADTLGSERFADRFSFFQPAAPEGRLVTVDGKTTYVTGGFWSNLTNEVCEPAPIGKARCKKQWLTSSRVSRSWILLS